MPTLTVRCCRSIHPCRYVGQPWNDDPQSQDWADVVEKLRTFRNITEMDLSRALTRMATNHEKWVNSNNQFGSQAISSEPLQPRFKEEGMEKYGPRTGEASFNDGSAWTPEAVKILQNYSVFAASFTGEVGLAPKSAKVGDYICSFEGSNVWAFLCKQTAGYNTLRLPEEGEIFGMIVLKTMHSYMSIVRGSWDAHNGDQQSFVRIDLASLQSLTQPDRPVAG